jgi:hypothetical protein
MSTDHYPLFGVSGGLKTANQASCLGLGKARPCCIMTAGKATGMLHQVMVKTSNPDALRPLLRSALQRELKLLEQGMRRTRLRLSAFEKQYSMNTDEFLRRFTKDDLGETLDFIEWYGETKMLAALAEQKKAIEGTSVP